MEGTGEKHINHSEAELMALAEKYRNSLISYIMKYVDVAEDAEDICQRSYEKVFVNINQFNPKYAFSTWLFNIARNEAIDHLRRERNSINAVSIDMGGEAMNILASSTPEEEVIEDQAIEKVLKSIEALPQDYAEVARMRFIQDYAYEDIAQKLDIPLGTVKTRINRARQMLSKAVKSENGRDS